MARKDNLDLFPDLHAYGECSASFGNNPLHI